MNAKSIKKCFIANRGEISRRIALTARTMGIKTVAASAKTHAPDYLKVIDEIIKIEREDLHFYLNQNLLINIALDNNCDAIHPGYGFLSENFEFAQKCIDAGLIWIGPNPSAIKSMSDKFESKSIAEKLRIPTIPSFNAFDPNDTNFNWQELIAFTNAHKPPLLIKGVAAGGGKGMKIVQDLKQLKELCVKASRESQSYFNNPYIILEEYLGHPRHIEVQVVADKYSNICTIGDRDCSIQRRYQKIIEEAPAPNISEEIRNSLHKFAKKLAAEVNYDSVGSVEFLVQDEQIYFLEMNTRLQVEHTVTEEAYSVDLVELQINSAQNRVLPEHIEDLQALKTSIEARIYAENPAFNFIPSPSDIDSFTPYYEKGVRWDVGIDNNDKISIEFDPMLAKCIVSASSREMALNCLSYTLNHTQLDGPTTNINFLTQIISSKDFVSATHSTNFVTDNIQNLTKDLTIKSEINQDKEFKLDIQSLAERVFNKDYIGDSLSNVIKKNDSTSLLQNLVSIKSEQNDNLSVVSPINGRVIAVNIDKDSNITKDSVLFVVESMKMEIDVKAPRSGCIDKILIAQGSQINDGDILALFKDNKGEAHEI